MVWTTFPRVVWSAPFGNDNLELNLNQFSHVVVCLAAADDAHDGRTHQSKFKPSPTHNLKAKAVAYPAVIVLGLSISCSCKSQRFHHVTLSPYCTLLCAHSSSRCPTAACGVGDVLHALKRNDASDQSIGLCANTDLYAHRCHDTQSSSRLSIQHFGPHTHNLKKSSASVPASWSSCGSESSRLRPYKCPSHPKRKMRTLNITALIACDTASLGI